MKNYLLYPKREYFSKNDTQCLKGIMASMVLISHLRGRIPVLNDTVIGSLLTVLGYLSVSVFFFISGYGLMDSYRNKGSEYIKDFPKNRILPFYGMCICWIGIYAIFDLLTGNDITVTDILLSVSFGGTVILNGWYLQTILVFYILFYVSFRFAGKYKVHAVAAGTALYIGSCVVLGLSTTWYEAVGCFLLGILWDKYREKIDAMLSEKRCYVKVFFLAAVCFGAFLLAGNTGVTGQEMIRVFCKMLSSISFVILTVLVMGGVSFRCKLTKWLGGISFEIYVSQGMVMSLLRGDLYYVKNDCLYIVLTIVFILGVSRIMNPVMRHINLAVKQCCISHDKKFN